MPVRRSEAKPETPGAAWQGQGGAGNEMELGGLEPPASTVRLWRSPKLSYSPFSRTGRARGVWSLWDLNP